MSSQTNNANDLLKGALDDGDLSQASFAAITINADIGAQIQAGLGISPDDVPGSEVVLVTIMPDDSGSIQFAGNAGAVRDGHNLVIESLKKSKQNADVLVHTRYLNGLVLSPYRPLEQAVLLDKHNYSPGLSTPLYDQTVVLLATVLAKTRELEQNGVPVRTVTLIITDGADCHSERLTAASVRPVIEDMLRMEKHIVAAMGLSDGQTDFKRIFREMGVPDQWILTPRNSASDIRKAFHVFSQSAVRVSQGAAASLKLGGFVN